MVGRRLRRVRKHKVGLPPHKLAGEPAAVGKVAAGVVAVVAAAAVAVRNTRRQQARRTSRQ